MSQKQKINFTDYDVLGFDMDFTLARYELVQFFNMVYEEICKYLVNVKNYDAAIFHSLAMDRDLIYKGLVAHFVTGNILKIGHDGTILRASHGTRKLREEEIIETYGKEKLFEHFKNLKQGMKSQDSTWRMFENYFDIPGLVAFAKTIDYKEEKGTQLSSEDYLQIWKDVYSSLENMYTPSQFGAHQGGYFPNLKADMGKYIDTVSSQVKSWLTNLRTDGRILFLLTTSHQDYASLVMETAFGEDWKSLFDLCLYGARKPYFFTESRRFTELDGLQPVQEVDTLKQGMEYNGGNHATLMNFLSEITAKKNPKVLYFGDNLWADAFPSTQLGSWDCVLILEEMDAEGYAVSDGTVPGHDDEVEDPTLPPAKRKRRFEHSSLVTAEEVELLVSNFWGSVFIDDSNVEKTCEELKMNTALGHLISMFASICVPSIEYLSGIPVDHSFSTFSSEPGNALGFHPGRPKSLLQSS